MWRTFRRKDSRTQSGVTAPADLPVQTVRATDEELFAQIEQLTEVNRQRPSADAELRLVAMRHLAGLRLLDGAQGDPRHPDPDPSKLPGADALPEILPQDLTAGLLRAGILRDGCVLVRGLIPRPDAVRFAEQIDRAYAERERHQSGQPSDAAYYAEFSARPGRGEELAREWVQAGGGVLAVDSPRLSFEMVDLFQRAALPSLVDEYLGEPALISGQKTTLRKAEPSVPGAWHQDGKFLGPVRALNLWLSLSHCGDEAPGLDLVPRRIDELVVTQTEEAMLDYMISQQRAEEAAGETSIIRPIFEPGDALFFDEMFLHKTGSDPSMPKPRYAIENWFFGASAFPTEYAPLAV
jgi:hypothetical protein